MTSCGANGGPLKGEGEYPAYIACSLYCRDEALTVGMPGDWMDCRFPRITQDQPDGVEGNGYIFNMRQGAVAGFRYFDCRQVKRIAVRTRGGWGHFIVRTAWDGEPAGTIELSRSNEWKTFTGEVPIPDGVQSLYFEFDGKGKLSFASFELLTEPSGNN